MQGYCDIFSNNYFEADVNTSTRHQDAKVEHFDVSNVINHTFSHGAVSYTLNGKNIMLEFTVTEFNYTLRRRALIYRDLPTNNMC